MGGFTHTRYMQNPIYVNAIQYTGKNHRKIFQLFKDWGLKEPVILENMLIYEKNGTKQVAKPGNFFMITEVKREVFVESEGTFNSRFVLC